MHSPYFKLAPKDIAVLENDPAMRQRHTELAVETIMDAASASSGGAAYDAGALAIVPSSVDSFVDAGEDMTLRWLRKTRDARDRSRGTRAAPI
jgi:hypothetical protein